MNEKKVYLPKTFKLEEFKNDIIEQCKNKNIDLSKDNMLSLLYNDPYFVFREYQNYTNSFMDSINSHVDEKNFWKYFGNSITEGFMPSVSSAKKYDISMKLIESVSKRNENCKNSYYSYKLKNSTDLYKNFEISLLPNDDENEKVSEVVLYGKIVDNPIDPKIKCYIPICGLLNDYERNKNKSEEKYNDYERNKNVYSLPKYLGMCPYMDFFIIFEIENNTHKVDKFICVDHIILHQNLRKILADKHNIFNEMWKILEDKSKNGLWISTIGKVN